jgi:bisanhydrobacterioruberin hydratase
MKQFFLNQWHNHRERLFIIVILFFWVTGFIQAAFGLTYVIRLTPIVLALLTAGALAFWDIPAKRKALIAGILIASGYVIEVVGVQTGLLFGEYTYGTLLGFKLFGVPLTIGITWFLVCLSAWHIVLFWSEKTIWLKILLAGVLVVMFDLVLEQFAVAYGFWAWAGGEIPLFNYVCWFVFGALFVWIIQRLSHSQKSSLYVAAMLPIMSIFFWLMLILA